MTESREVQRVFDRDDQQQWKLLVSGSEISNSVEEFATEKEREARIVELRAAYPGLVVRDG